MKSVINISTNDTETVHRWLTEHIEAARGDIAKLQANVSVREAVAELPVKPFGKGKRPTKHELKSESYRDTLLALDAAGKKGMTAKELANFANIPTGSASSRLSLLKSRGKIAHVQPRYFAQHSKPDDNNSEDGL